ncbi:hypothetical protein CHS0354_036867 [Potamilus streckersoni]|uniref:Uncharacterized protein n=1 Tax=Potamilus streckersoni TaxID=2493646 RepID=A0AAE0S1A7_9BIVA|nr:hypothetical protein CHS0354_036867 [Potamilus streckersoni]
MWFKVLVLFYITLAVCGQTMNDSGKLMEDLLNGYNKYVRPVSDQSEPVNLNISMDLVAVHEVDEVLAKFSIVALIYITWVDIRMTWDSSNYNGAYTTTIPVSNVWAPQMLVANSFRKIEPIGGDWMTVRYYDSGIAVYAAGDVFETTCAVDLTFYPFDTQTCKILLVPWGSLPNEVTIQSSSDYVSKTYFSANGEWEVISTSVDTPYSSSFSLIQFNIKIKRRPTFFLINVVIPIIFMGFLNILVFILPTESGERISFAITVLLAITVFLTLVGDNMPKTSEPMAMICYFLLENLSLSTFICLITILNLWLYHKPESMPVPRLFAVIARKLNCMSVPIRNAVHPISQEFRNGGIKEMSSKLSKGSDQIWSSNEELSIDVSWKDVSKMVDKAMCILSFLWLIISSTMFIVMLSNNQEINVRCREGQVSRGQPARGNGTGGKIIYQSAKTYYPSLYTKEIEVDKVRASVMNEIQGKNPS